MLNSAADSSLHKSGIWGSCPSGPKIYKECNGRKFKNNQKWKSNCILHVVALWYESYGWICRQLHYWQRYVLNLQVASGGVASNMYYRQGLTQVCDMFSCQLICPPPHLCTDNGIMIAWYVKYNKRLTWTKVLLIWLFIQCVFKCYILIKKIFYTFSQWVLC